MRVVISQREIIGREAVVEHITQATASLFTLHFFQVPLPYLIPYFSSKY